MGTNIKFPLTMAQRLAFGEGPVRLPATFRDFVEVLEVCDYPLEFQNDEIILMSIASDEHEQIVANILFALISIFKGNARFKRYGSNRHIYIPDSQTAFSPDASIVEGDVQTVEYAKGKTAILNPWLVVEVLSDSTRQRDWDEKLPRYKQIPSMAYVVLIEQSKPFVTVFKREAGSAPWSSQDFAGLDQAFLIEGKAIRLADVYENVFQ